jgi:hypothetical protein
MFEGDCGDEFDLIEYSIDSVFSTVFVWSGEVSEFLDCEVV